MGKHLLYKTISDHPKPFLYISKNLAKFPLFIGHRRHFTAVPESLPGDSVGI
jgi:hypothetical protein